MARARISRRGFIAALLATPAVGPMVQKAITKPIPLYGRSPALSVAAGDKTAAPLATGVYLGLQMIRDRNVLLRDWECVVETPHGPTVGGVPIRVRGDA